MHRRTVLKFLGLSTAALGLSGKRTLSATPLAGSRLAYNQAGYLPAAAKRATVRVEGAAEHSFGSSFQIISDHSGHPVFQGRLATPTRDAASGDLLAQADFSSFRMPGIYRLVTQGERSGPFPIGHDVYSGPLRLAIRAFYGQRCGCAIDLGDGYKHPPCHLAGAYHPTSGRAGRVPNHGGWHDAGDYGRYVVNSGITTATLLWAWELYPQALKSISLNIPESGGKVPDYLAEVRWNLEWMLSLQDEDGGVWQKQTSEQFCPFIMPQDDKLTSYIIGTGTPPYKSTCATADLAAVAAIAARCYSSYDPAFSARCLSAARRGLSWAMTNPHVIFTNPPGIGTGEYGDKQCSDEILWASAELWRTTGEAKFEQAFLARVKDLPPETSIKAPDWSEMAPMAYWTYALSERNGPDQLGERIRKQTATAAQALMARGAANGYGNTLAAEDYIWGSNSVAANHSLLLLMANHFEQNPQAVEAALGNLHYLLGRNCFGVSWVTHVGTKPFQHPHHRPSAADSIPAPWPGLMSGGPNARPGDPVARTLVPSPPMRMWLDDQRAYSLNEVAINWNAPLVFLLAAADSASRG